MHHPGSGLCQIARLRHSCQSLQKHEPHSPWQSDSGPYAGCLCTTVRRGKAPQRKQQKMVSSFIMVAELITFEPFRHYLWCSA